MYNGQNHHYWSRENPLRVRASHNQVRFSFNCWFALMSKSVVMMKYCDGTLNSAAYNEVILENLQTQLDEWPLTESRKVYFQQDSTSPYNSRLTHFNLKDADNSEHCG
ncbi:unnamed protein product [Euphydryas editha]|uniref:Transposase n=1 Tax=Euphydryas editha TaxID=104508 RepID=A0AAU9UNL8_EUPED|nr:unnamed protein product [Euphydryas editha]